ncbi:hypothetical protein [Sedimenticola selenatireducens]|uniref:hypothetical protein n=1 Tax=Sedimenticola selenatireducens TaxID=191960 RepID=UPI00164338D1|nr:hypothetical protein [Sedimenticola selenatireducens]
MTNKIKGLAGWHQARPKIATYTAYFIRFGSRIKVAIVTLTLWGLIPIVVAEWAVRIGERDEK